MADTCHKDWQSQSVIIQIVSGKFFKIKLHQKVKDCKINIAFYWVSSRVIMVYTS